MTTLKEIMSIRNVIEDHQQDILSIVKEWLQQKRDQRDETASDHCDWCEGFTSCLEILLEELKQ